MVKTVWMPERPEAYRVSEELSPAGEQTLELREEQLVAHKDLRELGTLEVRTEIDELPGRLEVDALSRRTASSLDRVARS
jgi:stress response protein YsnF